MADDGDGDTTFTQEEVDAQLAEMTTQLEAAKTKVGEFRDNNIELKNKVDGGADALKALEAKFATLEQDRKAADAGIAEDALKEMRADVEAKLEKEYSDKYSDYDDVLSENTRLKLDDKAKSRMANAGVRAERIDALFTITQADFSLSDEGGLMITGRTGKDVDSYITEDLGKMYPEFFTGSGSSGGGASKSGAGSIGATEVARGDNDAFLANVDGIAKGDVTVV